MLPRVHFNLFGIVACLMFSGCVLGPKSLQHSRSNYNLAVQQTAREEMLLNLVRLKYHQSEEFIRIPSITGQFTYDAKLGSSGAWQEGAATKFGLSLGLGATSKPTIVYTPEQAQEFNRRLLSPIGLETIDLLTSKGWAFNRVLRVTVRNINDVDNATSAGGPTPDLKPEFEEFKYLADLLRDLQKHGRQIEIAYEDQVTSEPSQLSDEIPADTLEMEDVILAAEKGYEIRLSEDGLTQSLWTQESTEQVLILMVAPEAHSSRQMQEVRQILELTADETAYRLRPDTNGQLAHPHHSRSADLAANPDRKDLTVSTRSLKEIMFYLSHGISVPCDDIENGYVQSTFDYEGQPFDWNEMTGDLFQVKVHRKRPHDAAVAVKYRDHWFYIPECDLDSKSTFNLLLELFNLEIRAGGGAQIPLLTI